MQKYLPLTLAFPKMKLPVLTISLMLLSFAVFAQEEGQLKKKIPVNSNQPNNRNNPNNGNSRKETDKKDSTLGFEHRDDLKDSINITYRFLDSLRRNTMDSSINDFDRYFPIPTSWQYLGNNGAAATPLIFQPYMKPGWDAGFHAFDVYRFTLEGL